MMIETMKREKLKDIINNYEYCGGTETLENTVDDIVKLVDNNDEEDDTDVQDLTVKCLEDLEGKEVEIKKVNINRSYCTIVIKVDGERKKIGFFAYGERLLDSYLIEY